MQRAIRTAISVGVCAACTVACSSAEDPGNSASRAIGSWRLVEAPGATAFTCTQTIQRTTFFPNGAFEFRNAEMVLTGTYISRPLRNGREHMKSAYTNSNGRPNCQGLSADYVIRHSPPEFEVERRGDDLYVCPIASSDCIVRLTRER